jgi:hypothetical protein
MNGNQKPYIGFVVAIFCLQTWNSIFKEARRDWIGTLHCSTICFWRPWTICGYHTFSAFDEILQILKKNHHIWQWKVYYSLTVHFLNEKENIKEKVERGSKGNAPTTLKLTSCDNSATISLNFESIITILDESAKIHLFFCSYNSCVINSTIEVIHEEIHLTTPNR